MEDTNIIQCASSYNPETELKQCWVCFGTNNDDYESNKDWVSPCKCRDSTQWVHQDCVKYWIDQKLKENIYYKPCCPRCQTYFNFMYEEVNYFVQLLNKLCKKSYEKSPFLAAGIVVSFIYWSATSYGAITMIQVMGKREAITMMENTDSFMLLLILPSIPLGLILGKMINWEEYLLLFVQKFILQLPSLRIIMPSFLSELVNSSTSTVQFNSVVNPKTTHLCAALSLPITATIVGNLLFGKSSYSKLQKTLLGGLVYIAVKGVLKIYQRQHNVIKEKTRKFINYPETNAEESN